MVHLRLLLCAVVVAAGSLAAQQQQDVGKFDINKVREAVAHEGSDVSADTAAAAHSPQARHADSLGTIILRISAYLALIVLVIVLFVWLMRKTGMVGSSRIGGGTMDMLEALPIGQGRTIALVRVLDTVLVLAQSGQQITLLDKIEGQKALEVIASTKGGTSIVQFKEVFNSFFGKMKKSSS